MVVFAAWACMPQYAAGIEPPDFGILVNLRVDGEYNLQRGDRCMRGKYRCDLSARAVLKRDRDGDFILYGIYGEAPEDGIVHWTESTPGGSNIHLEDAVQPELRMRFALREMGRVSLDLLVAGNMDTPILREYGSGLLLPRSRTGAGGDAESLYNRFVGSGSNRVEWREIDMENPKGVSGDRKWEWRRIYGPWTHFHKVLLSFHVKPLPGESR